MALPDLPHTGRIGGNRRDREAEHAGHDPFGDFSNYLHDWRSWRFSRAALSGIVAAVAVFGFGGGVRPRWDGSGARRTGLGADSAARDKGSRMRAASGHPRREGSDPSGTDQVGAGEARAFQACRNRCRSGNALAQASFKCVACGHAQNAVLNAARSILASTTGASARRGALPSGIPVTRETDTEELWHDRVYVGAPACMCADTAEKFVFNQRVTKSFPKNPSLRWAGSAAAWMGRL